MTTHEIRYRIDGMDCGACAAKIETAVRRLADVAEADVNFASETLTVRHRGSADLPKAIEKIIRGLGFTIESKPPSKSLSLEIPAAPDSCCEGKLAQEENGHEHALRGAVDHSHGHDERPKQRAWWTSDKGRLTIAYGLALSMAWAAGQLLPQLEAWFFSAAMLIGLVPIARRAVMAARTGTPFSIEMLMSVAAVGAVIIGASEEAAAVVFLFLIGELLEGVAAGKARASIQSLTELVPKTALLEENGQTREVQAESLIVGSTILVRPGDRIPADGIVLSGESAIDEAPVTGESTPVRKGAGTAVFAGTINGEAVLRIRVTAAAEDNTIARVVKLVEQAQEAKAPTERFINRFASYYTPGVVVVAALVALVPPLFFDGSLSGWTYKGLAILLIGCPCALVISTPAAIAAALSSGARRGLLIKGGAVLERLRDVTAVALDKTGTLTAGKPRVTDVIAFGRSEAEVLRLAAALEMGSSHPLAKAILDRVADHEMEVPPVSNAKAIGGKGVSGLVEGVDTFFGSPQAAAAMVALSLDQSAKVTVLNEEGKTVSILVANGCIAGMLAMRDEPRADALSGLRALTASGIKTVMLTGDNRRAAEAIGRQLGIEVYAELLPEDKQRIVGELREKGFVVAKIGDGINDAPALAAADVGIAMGGGTDVALETADAAILHGRVGDIKQMIALSKKTMANIHQNVAIALGLKAIFLVTTIIGVTGLWPAILADTGATVLVTGNAMRLLRTKPDSKV
ncbi:heavy metal translocating P-type ATPase [Hyphomicrobium sp. 2TAF46]|uniref:heavy metal translocating P-type ATPase n=1 Tax=Hyphomicrobium sp. 2TAF46 TaxID=3233019 RepID=UPI003F8ED16C